MYDDGDIRIVYHRSDLEKQGDPFARYYTDRYYLYVITRL